MHEIQFVRGMALTRLVSGSIEVSAAILMLRFGRIETAVGINAALGLVGPTIFAVTAVIGFAGLAGHVPWSKMLWIALGVLLVVFGATR